MTENLPKIYLSMIVGNFEEIDIVNRSIESVLPYVDGVYVTVTYKDSEKLPDEKHKLIKALKKLGANVSTFCWTYNFAEARQFAMEQVPKGVHNYIYWQDADDVLKGGENLRKVAKESDESMVAAVYFDYWYNVDLDENGDVREIVIKHKRERLVRNDDTWKWVGALHETLIEQQQENVIKLSRPECVVIHLSKPDRFDVNIERNINILETNIKKEEGRDPRTKIYLAKAYFDKARMNPSGKDFKIYLNLALTLFYEYLEGVGEPGTPDYREPSGWREERGTAWNYVGEIAVLSQNLKVAEQAFLSAIDEAYEFPEYYISLSWVYLGMGKFKKAKHWLNIATTIPEPETTIISLPRELKLRALEVSYQLNMHYQKLDLALEDAKNLLSIKPEDEGLKERLKQTADLVNANRAAQSIVFLGKYLESTKEESKLESLVKAIPAGLNSEKFAAEMRHRFSPVKEWEGNEITILCGPGFEEWTPESTKTGLGGSEEAVVYLSKELTKLGWKVTVFANPGNLAGDFDGVQYRPWYELNPKDSFNVLILWRGIGFVDINPMAKFTMLWLHDVPNNPDFTEERMERIDKIAVLSEYHKSLLRMKKGDEFIKIPEDKIFLTSNGIPDIKPANVKRESHRLMYMSSPDRGLSYLLKNWGDIRKKVNDAELHIFYGFNIYDAIHHNNPARMAWKEKILEMMKQPGIIHHDRVGHEQLNEELSRSAVWAYPTDFTEISCISAMKAQALGAIPVTTTLAALDETVKNGIKLDADIILPEVQKEYIDKLTDLLKNEESQEEIRPNMMKWAQEYFQWSNVAKLWNKLFKDNLKN